MERKEIALGDEVKDVLTGISGIVVCLTTWLYGCSRIGIQPQGTDKDGKAHEIRYIDEPQCEMVRQAALAPVVMRPVEQRTIAQPGTGGPARESSSFRR